MTNINFTDPFQNSAKVTTGRIVSTPNGQSEGTVISIGPDETVEQVLDRISEDMFKNGNAVSLEFTDKAGNKIVAECRREGFVFKKDTATLVEAGRGGLYYACSTEKQDGVPDGLAFSSREGAIAFERAVNEGRTQDLDFQLKDGQAAITIDGHAYTVSPQEWPKFKAVYAQALSAKDPAAAQYVRSLSMDVVAGKPLLTVNSRPLAVSVKTYVQTLKNLSDDYLKNAPTQAKVFFLGVYRGAYTGTAAVRDADIAPELRTYLRNYFPVSASVFSGTDEINTLLTLLDIKAADLSSGSGTSEAIRLLGPRGMLRTGDLSVYFPKGIERDAHAFEVATKRFADDFTALFTESGGSALTEFGVGRGAGQDKLLAILKALQDKVFKSTGVDIRPVSTYLVNMLLKYCQNRPDISADHLATEYQDVLGIPLDRAQPPTFGEAVKLFIDNFTHPFTYTEDKAFTALVSTANTELKQQSLIRMLSEDCQNKFATIGKDKVAFFQELYSVLNKNIDVDTAWLAEHNVSTAVSDVDLLPVTYVQKNALGLPQPENLVLIGGRGRDGQVYYYCPATGTHYYGADRNTILRAFAADSGLPPGGVLGYALRNSDGTLSYKDTVVQYKYQTLDQVARVSTLR